MMVTDRVMVVIVCCTSRPICLNHHQPVGGLHSSALQPVVKNRIFVGNQIKAGGVVHYPDADVAGVFIAQERIRVVDCAEKNAVENRQGEFRHHQPPESAMHRLMGRHGMHDAINNELRNPQKPDWQKRGENPRYQPKNLRLLDPSPRRSSEQPEHCGARRCVPAILPRSFGVPSCVLAAVFKRIPLPDGQSCKIVPWSMTVSPPGMQWPNKRCRNCIQGLLRGWFQAKGVA